MLEIRAGDDEETVAVNSVFELHQLLARCGAVEKPNAADLDSKEDSTGGMSVGQKAGVAAGVITGAFVVGAGVVVCKKRQQNIQWSQYGYAARREIM
ncbi:hypothetical protein SASPL_105249 [Salvia splendens]|uniref:Uncharacterized protein n=1 Tax=Salvia splendens TaxID=180675 RepID=A0A8X9ABF1_SALSN|nr:hypothetical protein SASPL_105249 [Salvia splendens]